MTKKGKDTMPRNLHGIVCCFVKQCADPSHRAYELSQAGLTVKRTDAGVHLNAKAAEALVA